jgi:FAD/FMN-containing dehydrogenase
MGGALSLRPGIVLDLKSLNRILVVSPENLTARVEAGVVLNDLNQELRSQELMLGHDPWTVSIATVGGTISTNSLGYMGGKYGSMGDQVLGLEAVLPMGECVSTRPVQKTSTGLDLYRLFIGTEGCFGVITQVTLRVFTVPEERLLQAYQFPNFETGFAAIVRLFHLGLKPSLLDYGDSSGEDEGPADLYIGFEGTHEIAQAETKRCEEVCEKGRGVRQPDRKAKRFWKERHSIADWYKRTRPQRLKEPPPKLSTEYLHVALPISQVLAYRRRCLEIFGKSGIRIGETGLWTHPELFSIVFQQQQPEGKEAFREAVTQALMLVQDMGGSMEYCHGVGVKLASLLAREHGYGLEVMRQIKRTLDPNGILNPGKLDL